MHRNDLTKSKLPTFYMNLTHDSRRLGFKMPNSANEQEKISYNDI